MDQITVFLSAHPKLALAVALWVGAANILARIVQRPDPSASLRAKILYALFIDLPPRAVPTKHPVAGDQLSPLKPERLQLPSDKGFARTDALLVLAMLVCLAGFALAVTGCASTGTGPKQPIAVQTKLAFDHLNAIAQDVKAKCGVGFQPLGPTIASALLTASSMPNALGIVQAVLQSAPTVIVDAEALVCAFQVVVNDLKEWGKWQAPTNNSAPGTSPEPVVAPQPQPPTSQLLRGIELGEQAIYQLSRRLASLEDATPSTCDADLNAQMCSPLVFDSGTLQ